MVWRRGGKTYQRARAEQTLRKLWRAIEQTSDSVFLIDHDGIIEHVKPAFERMTGFAEEEAVGQTPRLFNSDHHEL